MAIRFLGKGVVGIDLCGDPAAGSISSLSAFTPVFQKARALGLGVTIHFAEAECSGTDAELQLLLSWQPDRLGHVICVSDTIKQEIKKRGGLGLELCLSCNVHAGMVSGGFEGQYVEFI